MSRRSRKSVQDVRRVLDEVAEAEPQRVGLRASQGRLAGRYTMHGEPCCLVAEMLVHMGFRIGRLKTLDRAADGQPIRLRDSWVRNCFEPLAFDMLCYIQYENDRGRTWGQVRKDALSIDDYWAHFPKYRYRGKEWLAETPALNLADYER